MSRPRSFSCAAALLALACAGLALPASRARAATPPKAPPLVRSTGSEVRPREPMNGADLALAIRKLRVLGSVLYIAAHPDDENTALLTYLSQGRLVRTAYLSVTRGDGGQNLIGAETSELLGVIRTQELLAARRLDGAEQYFTRANDFGFSKTPDETMAIWGRDSILADVVWVIRNYRPDVIVTRFATDGSGGHGHHTASAILAEEAFRAAADPKRFPEQLASVEPWQAKRIMWNAFNPALVETVATRIRIDVGTYDPMLGRSYSEIAGLSRSMHKSQGFGAPERRGSIPNALVTTQGEPARNDLFDGVTTNWSRIPGGSKVEALLADVDKSFDPKAPAKSIPALLKAHAAMRALAQDPWVTLKREELAEVVRSCAGLWLEAIATKPSAAPGAPVTVNVSALNRSDAKLTLESIELPYGATVAPVIAPTAVGAVADSAGATASEVRDRALTTNRAVAGRATVTLPAEVSPTQPYWLRAPLATAGTSHAPGRFVVADPTSIGRAENGPALTARFVIRAGDERFEFLRPVVYRWTDPVTGERYRPLEIVPAVALRFDHATYVFPSRDAHEVRVTASSTGAAAQGRLSLGLPDGWRAEPDRHVVTLGAAAETSVTFLVTPPATASAAGANERVSVSMAPGTETSLTRMPVQDRSVVRIDYAHIPIQTLCPPAEAKLVRTDATLSARDVGYVMGSGDAVDDALEQLGARVNRLTDDGLERGDLSNFDAIVIGVRAFNTRPRLRALMPRLLDYVREGGTLVVQYQTADTSLKMLGPYPLTISRDRVTVEEAPVRVTAAGDALVTKPNKIADADFEGWVQERGLYFANPYDPRYKSVLASNDPGEPSREGGMLTATYGKGTYVYTGYAFFRQLPAGVPGAYRLFANLVSAKQNESKPSRSKSTAPSRSPSP